MNSTARSALAPRLLLVEDDDAARRKLQLLLTGQGYQVQAFSRAALALADPAAIMASHLVIDHDLPEADGMQALRVLQSHGWKGCAVLVTATYSRQLRDTALGAGFAALLPKPVRGADLLDALVRGAPAADQDKSG